MSKKKFSQTIEDTQVTGTETVTYIQNDVNKNTHSGIIKTMVNKFDFGLGNADNTSDMDKPVTNILAVQLTGKADINHDHEFFSVYGPREVYNGTENEYLITDYDLHDNYEVTAITGSVTRTKAKIYYTAPNLPTGNDGFIVNGREYNIIVNMITVNKPIIISPVQNEETAKCIDVSSSIFATVTGSYTHDSSDWEVSTNSAFTNIIKSSYNDTVNKVYKSMSFDYDLYKNQTLYIRVRHKNNQLGSSNWSDPVSFTIITNVFLDRQTTLLRGLGLDSYLGSYFFISKDGKRLLAYQESNLRDIQNPPTDIHSDYINGVYSSTYLIGYLTLYINVNNNWVLSQIIHNYDNSIDDSIFNHVDANKTNFKATKSFDKFIYLSHRELLTIGTLNSEGLYNKTILSFFNTNFSINIYPSIIALNSDINDFIASSDGDPSINFYRVNFSKEEDKIIISMYMYNGLNTKEWLIIINAHSLDVEKVITIPEEITEIYSIESYSSQTNDIILSLYNQNINRPVLNLYNITGNNLIFKQDISEIIKSMYGIGFFGFGPIVGNVNGSIILQHDRREYARDLTCFTYNTTTGLYEFSYLIINIEDLLPEVSGTYESVTLSSDSKILIVGLQRFYDEEDERYISGCLVFELINGVYIHKKTIKEFDFLPVISGQPEGSYSFGFCIGITDCYHIAVGSRFYDYDNNFGAISIIK